jgi:hypothetical protein
MVALGKDKRYGGDVAMLDTILGNLETPDNRWIAVRVIMGKKQKRWRMT